MFSLSLSDAYRCQLPGMLTRKRELRSWPSTASSVIKPSKGNNCSSFQMPLQAVFQDASLKIETHSFHFRRGQLVNRASSPSEEEEQPIEEGKELHERLLLSTQGGVLA
ncbi:hypothetical protein D5086_007062 [Populus alba]|uniref:Uncharacterized protein n=1 Tax=Populus alba TaxID=43335 RepID=A0ACC4CMB6_POPAL